MNCSQSPTGKCQISILKSYDCCCARLDPFDASRFALGSPADIKEFANVLDAPRGDPLTEDMRRLRVTTGLHACPPRRTRYGNQRRNRRLTVACRPPDDLVQPQIADGRQVTVHVGRLDFRRRWLSRRVTGHAMTSSA